MSTNRNEERAVPVDLKRCREEIERVDSEIISLLKQRVELARETGALKREHGLPILDPQREAQVISGAVAKARAAGLEAEQVRDIFWHILELSRLAQNMGKE